MDKKQNFPKKEIRNYRDLNVWKESMKLAAACYEATKKFPQSEMFGLVSQIRRASVSIPANIAEGHSQKHTKVFLRALSIAYGSLAELETHIEISVSMKYLDANYQKTFFEQTEIIGKMINGLRKSLYNRPLTPESKPQIPRETL